MRGSDVGERGGGEAHGGEESSSKELPQFVVCISSRGPPYVGGRGAPLPPTKATLGPAAKGGMGQPRAA
jgi:hypothetical protein